MVIPPSVGLVGPHPESWVQSGAPQRKQDADILEQVQFNASTTAGVLCLFSLKQKAGSGHVLLLSTTTSWEDAERLEPLSPWTGTEAPDSSWKMAKSL